MHNVNKELFLSFHPLQSCCCLTVVMTSLSELSREGALQLLAANPEVEHDDPRAFHGRLYPVTG